MFDSFPVRRAIIDHWIFVNPKYLKIWIYILGNTSYIKEEKTKMYNKVLYPYRYGEFIFGLKHWSEVLNIGIGTIRGCFKLLIETNTIYKVEGTSSYTIYAVTNYEKYNQQDNTLLALENKEVAEYQNNLNNNHSTTASQQLKKVKKDKTKDIVVSAVENTELERAIDDFIEMRKVSRKVMTARAKAMMLKRLDELATTEDDKVKILNQSTINNWSNIYALKQEYKKSDSKITTV
jgi:hypothetical protein